MRPGARYTLQESSSAEQTSKGHWSREQAPKLQGPRDFRRCGDRQKLTKDIEREQPFWGSWNTPHRYSPCGVFFFRPYSWRAPTVSNRAFFPPGISPVTAKLGGSTTCAQPSGLAERGVRLPTVLHTHTCRRRRCSRRSMWWGMSWGGGRWWRTRGRRVSRLRDTLDRGTTVLA